MNDTQLQELQKISDLQAAFTGLYILDGDTFKPRLGKGKNVYDSKRKEMLAEFEKGLNSVGIDPKSTPKQIELSLQQKYEAVYKLLKQTPKFKNDRPNDMPAKTTLDATESADLIEQAEKRAQQSIDIKAREKQAIEDYIKQNEERIANAKNLQEKLKDKVVYAKIVIPEEEKLTQEEQKELEVLVAKAKNDTPVAGKVLTPKQELIDDFTLEIEKKLESVLKDLPEKEKEIIARTYAVEIIEKIANPETVVDERVQTVILDNIAKPKQQVVTKILQKDDELITLAKNGAILIATKQNDDFSALEKITANLVGPKIASKILGKQNYQVTFSEVHVQGETTHIIRFEELNQQSMHELSRENIVLTTLQQHGQQFGYDKINSIFTTYLNGRADSLPAGSVIKKAYKDPIVQSIFARYGMAEPVVWQAVGQSKFVGLVMKIAPDTAGPVLGLVGKITGKQIVAPIATKVAGQVASKVATQAAGKATGAGLGATIGAITGLAGGPLAIATAAVGALIGELLSKAQIWFKKNKDKVAPILGVGAAGLIAPFFGAGPAVLGGVGAFALFGGSVAGLATGAFGVLGLIGRSVGIAIATPVIVTLLVLPPLVAFIMLVINNSAYVVPPTPIGKNIIDIPSGGNMTKCDPEETGEDITEQLASSVTAGSVQLLPDSAASRQEGLCITPTMIVLHSSGGYDNDDGNIRTYETLVSRQAEASCQMATDTNDTIFMLSFFENKVENAWCQHDLNDGGVGIELAGEFKADSPDSSNHGAFSKCSPEGSLMFTPDGPHPCAPLEDLAFDAVCKVMQQYSIPWTQVFQHEDAKLSPKEDPIGDEWVNKFITRLKNNCTIKQNDEVR